MEPKPKCKAPSSTQKKKEAAKSKRAQLPPNLPSPPRERLGHDEKGPSLKDVMTMVNSISASWLTMRRSRYQKIPMLQTTTGHQTPS